MPLYLLSVNHDMRSELIAVLLLFARLYSKVAKPKKTVVSLWHTVFFLWERVGHPNPYCMLLLPRHSPFKQPQWRLAPRQASWHTAAPPHAHPSLSAGQLRARPRPQQQK